MIRLPVIIVIVNNKLIGSVLASLADLCISLISVLVDLLRKTLPSQILHG